MGRGDPPGHPEKRVVWAYPKTGGIWVLCARGSQDPHIDELFRLEDEKWDAYDFQETLRLSEINVLRTEGARFYAKPADCDLAVARIRELGLSVPSGTEIPSNWPKSWYRKLNDNCWSRNNFLLFPKEGGVWILRDMTVSQGHGFLQEIARRKKDISATLMSLLVNDIIRLGGSFYADLEDPALRESMGHSVHVEAPLGPESAEYWIGKPAPWDVEVPADDYDEEYSD